MACKGTNYVRLCLKKRKKKGEGLSALERGGRGGERVPRAGSGLSDPARKRKKK